MARIAGDVGFVITEETTPGVWNSYVIEKQFFGDALKISKREESNGKVNEDLVLNHRISFIADPYTRENYALIKFVNLHGARWKVTSIDVEYPRLILTLGGVYNGE